MNTRAITQNKKVVTFGEVMLRLTAPNFQRFSQTNEFIATYGGSEANVAISLVNFGIPTEFVTRLPENAMAQACVNSLQAYGLGTDGIIYGGKRMGLYFLESGAAFRNSNVVYDRLFLCHFTSRHDRLGKDSFRCRLVPLVGYSSVPVTGRSRCLPGSTANSRPPGINNLMRLKFPQKIMELR